MKKAIINDLHSFEIEQEGSAVLIDGVRLEPDLNILSENHYHLIVNHRNYQVEIIEKDERNKSAVMMINGKNYRVVLKDEKDRLLESLGLEINEATMVKDLKTPMPGLVLDVLVGAGQHIKKGEQLLVLEAMKMENLIKSPSDLIVKSVEVKKGDKIEKGQPLLYFK